jgi:hypothetical protein
MIVKNLAYVLIVIDGSKPLQRAAKRLVDCLKDKRVVVKHASDFTPVDLLAAEAYFFGCAEARPAAFAEVERALSGINLAGRPCGLFSLASQEAVAYLRGVVADSELTVNPRPFLADAPAGAVDEAPAWTAETLARR